MQRSFRVDAIWDEEDQIWVSESDILGLHIEAAEFSEFVELVNEFASELIATNHFSDAQMEGKTLREVLPAVVISQIGGSDRAA